MLNSRVIRELKPEGKRIVVMQISFTFLKFAQEQSIDMIDR
jgi:hypothetical protein